MSDSNRVFTGSCGNCLVDFCDHYLYFGRKQDAIYRQQEGSKVIVGEDTSENWVLTLLRMSSWATFFFPMMAAMVRWSLKPSESKDLKEWKPVLVRETLEAQAYLSARYYQCLEVSKIAKIAYHNMYPCLLRKDRPQIFMTVMVLIMGKKLVRRTSGLLYQLVWQ